MARFVSSRAGFWSAFFFGLLPYNVYYSRAILPEPLMVALSLGAVYTFVLWIKKQDNLAVLFLSSILAAFAILVKPFAVFFFPPLVYLAITHVKINYRNGFLLLLYGAIALIPFGVWRLYIQQFPEGIPAYEWLFNKDNVRGKGSFFYWLFAERISKLILGYFGTAFLLLGIIADTRKKENLFFHVLGLSMLAYMFIIAGGNVQHDYYQVMVIPILAMYMGRAVDFLLQHSGTLFKPYLVWGTIGVATLFIFAFSWYQVRGYYWINNPAIVEAGKKADSLLPKDAKVIAPYGGDTAFLYQTGRQGWPQGFEIEDKIAKGATHYMSVTPDDAEVVYVKANHPVIYEEDGFVIIQLQ